MYIMMLAVRVHLDANLAWSEDLHFMDVPVLSSSDRKTRGYMRLPYILPHELVHYLHATRHSGYRCFKSAVSKHDHDHDIAKASGKVHIPQSTVDRFWQHLQSQESTAAWSAIHPGRNKMPIGLHGDDGRYNKANDRVILVTLNFPLAREISRDLIELCMFWLIFLHLSPHLAAKDPTSKGTP